MSVHQLTFILLRLVGVPFFVCRIYQRSTDWDRRIIAYPERYLPVVTPLCEFFFSSPDNFVPCGDCVCNIQGTSIPLAFGKRELLVMLWKLSEGTANHAYITSVYSQLDSIFREADDADLVKSFTTTKPEVAQAKTQLENVYRLWVQYIKRHYNYALMGRNDPARLNTRIRCIEALRNHTRPNPLNPTPVKELCDVLTLVDDTLCFNGDPQPSLPDFPGRVMGKKLLSWMMRIGRIPEKFRPEVIKILRLHQKILIRERKTHKTVQPHCFSYWRGNTEYLIFYQKDDGKYTYREDHKFYSGFARKNILLQGEDVVLDEAEKEDLYQFLKGSQKGLCELAKLTASCLCAQKLYKGAIVLPSEQAPALLVALSLAGGCDLKSMQAILKMSALSKKAAADQLIEWKLQGRLFGFSIDDGEQMNAQQWKRLRKIFSGVHVTYKDSILGRKMHRNNMEWLVIGNDQTVKKLVSHGIKAKRLPFTLELPPTVPPKSSWLQQILPLWGYLQLQKGKEKDEKPRYKTVQQFMDKCCRITGEKVEFIEAKTLYDHYKACCDEQGQNDVLKFKDFNDVLETTYGLKRIRHHFTDGRNPTGFDRIVFSAVPYGQRTAPEKRDRPLSSKEAFFLKLEQMEQEVRTHFIQYPFD